jgi:hypothetical protein
MFSKKHQTTKTFPQNGIKIKKFKVKEFHSYKLINIFALQIFSFGIRIDRNSIS